MNISQTFPSSTLSITMPTSTAGTVGTANNQKIPSILLDKNGFFVLFVILEILVGK